MSTPNVPSINTTELINQIQALAADHDAQAADVANWRRLVSLVGAKGYGPNITPNQIAALLPDANTISEVVAASAARKSRKGVPLGPRGSRTPGGNDAAGQSARETGHNAL